MSNTLQVIQAVNTILFGMVQANELLTVVSKMIAKKQAEEKKDFTDEEWKVIKELLSGANEKLRLELEKDVSAPV